MSDPYRLLGVPATADDETVRAAYLAAVRACPPERDREHFERVRAAYETIGTARARLAHALFDTTVPAPSEIAAAFGVEFKPRCPDARRLRRLLGSK